MIWPIESIWSWFREKQRQQAQWPGSYKNPRPQKWLKVEEPKNYTKLEDEGLGYIVDVKA